MATRTARVAASSIGWLELVHSEIRRPGRAREDDRTAARAHGLRLLHFGSDSKSISSGTCKFGRVYLHIHVHIHLAKIYTSQFFSGTCKFGRVYSNGYIFKRLYFQRLYFQTAIFSTVVFLVYINHPYHLSSSTSICDFSSHLDFSIVSHATQ